MEVLPYTPAGIEQAASYVAAGKLVLWPSPLCYGLSTNATDEKAIGRVYAAKYRPPTAAMTMLTVDQDDALRYADFNPVAEKLVEAYWPGLLGVIVAKRPEQVPDFVTAGLDTVLLACLDGLGHEMAKLAGVPMIATSANVSGTAPALSTQDAIDFAERAGEPVDAVLAGPVSPFNRPTTIVDTTVNPPTIRRLGVVHPESVRRVLPDVVVDDPKAGDW